jgi:hypothetical protein
MDELQKQQRTKLVIDTISKNLPALKRFSGITNAGAGLRLTNGRFTDEICIVIEVEKKKPLTDLNENEIIPSAIEDIPVDIIERRPAVLYDLIIPVEEAINQARYRPLQGGCQITNGIEVKPGQVSVGTLGCMVFIPASSKKNEYNALLSNYHVMFANGGKVGQAIGQPYLSVADTVGAITAGDKLGNEVDFAIAKQASGVACTNDVLTIGALTGFGEAYVGQRVRKYGRTTEYTIGQVTLVGWWMNPDPPYNIVYTGLTIYEGYPDINPLGRFSDGGDSGSVIVNNSNEVIGLLWGGNNSVPDATYANDQRRLHQVEGNFTIPVPTTFQMQQIFSDTTRLDKYKQLLQQSAHSREIYSEFVNNVEEGSRLVNEQRECMVAWQRLKGPAFISLIKDMDPEAPYGFERSVDGVAAEDMISGMATVFKKHGSKPLADAIGKHGEELTSYVSKSKTVEEIIAFIVRT